MIWLDSDEVEDEDVEDADFDLLQPKCSLDHLCQNFDSWSFLLLNFAVLIFVGGGIFGYEEDVDNADWLRQKCSQRREVLAARTHTEPDYTATATGQLNALMHLKKKNATIGP